MSDVCFCVRVKWRQFSWTACCVSRLTVSLRVAPPHIYHTCQSGAHLSTVSSGMGQRKCSAHPPSITPAVNRHPVSVVDFFSSTQTDWAATFCTDGLVQFVSIMGCETRLDTLTVSLPQPGKVENWLQVIWRRSYLLLTVEWHHNGAAGVQLPFSPPPPPPPLLLPSAFTSAFTDKLRLMTEISREPAYLIVSHGHVECESASWVQRGTAHHLVLFSHTCSLQVPLSLVKINLMSVFSF